MMPFFYHNWDIFAKVVKAFQGTWLCAKVVEKFSYFIGQDKGCMQEKAAQRFIFE